MAEEDGSYAARAQALREAGSFIVGCHPQEYLHGSENIRVGAQALHAFEIYNGLREARGANEAANIALWDELLTKGERIWGVAVDDFHCSYITPGHGWVCVQMPEEAETIKMIVEQLKLGAFFASTAPAFKEIFLDDGILRASTNRHVQRMRVIGSGGFGTPFQGTQPKGKTVYEVEGNELEWQTLPGLTYFRIKAECGVKRAWSHSEGRKAKGERRKLKTSYFLLYFRLPTSHFPLPQTFLLLMITSARVARKTLRGL